jgi:hypothetical protein
VDECWQVYADRFGEARLKKFRDELNDLYTAIRHSKGE